MEFSQKEEPEKRKAMRMVSFLVLTSALILSFVAAVQLSVSAAYGQNSAITVTGNCEFIPNNGTFLLQFNVQGSDSTKQYYYQVVDSDGDALYTRADTDTLGASFTFARGDVPPDHYTFNLYEDLNGNFDPTTIESDELIASGSVTCPTLADVFKNQGQCIQFVNTNPKSEISKDDCKAAFKS